jgi:alpha-L-rhamnosidase
MKKSFSTIIVLLLSLFVIACTSESTSITEASSPNNLLVEGIKSPINVHNKSPRFSWHANIVSQDSYQIQVSTKAALLSSGTADLWDSGRISEKRSINIAYKGSPLVASAEAFWRVRGWEKDAEEPQAWSEINAFEMGLLSESDWEAKWIQVAQPAVAQITQPVEDWILFAANVHEQSNGKLTEKKQKTQAKVVEQLKAQTTAGLFRYEFDIPQGKSLVKARLHSTAAGYYEIFLNGKKVDDRLMDPGQTDFDKRILYNTDKVADFLEEGFNTIAVHLGSGWYDEGIAFSKWNNPDADAAAGPSRSLSYGQAKFIAQLVLTFDDGSRQVVSSNENWLSHSSHILKEGVFSGELFDAREQQEDWHHKISPQKLANWRAVDALDTWPTKSLEPQLLPAIKAVKKLSPIELLNPQDNVWVLDFGQNFTGVPTIDFSKLPLAQDQAIHLRYAEWVDKAGNISQKSGGGAPLLKQVDTYIASGNDVSWTPTFTWHGFRYLELRGLSEAPSLDAISAHLLRSSVDVVGHFESSDELLNKIHAVALWGYESNLMALPMDCPIRERAGWTGDAHAALITGNYNYNMDNFWDKYLGDFQTAAFVAPAVVPGKRTHGGNFDWAAAEIMIAWEHYRHHGNLQLLADQYESMLEYMQAGEAKLNNSLLRIGYGDWCDPVKVPGTPRVNGRCSPQHTTPTITSSALFAHTANLMAKISDLLNKPEEAKHYAALFTQISNQFNQEFYDKVSAHYKSQTADAMAIMFEIAPKELRASVAKALNNDVINKWNGHASVGALGQTYVYRALSDYGYADTAFNIFKAKGYPGYSYLFDELNATTLWERKGFYDPKQDPDGTKAPGFSLNHPFHSGYDGWFYEGLGGIRPLPDSVGFQDFELVPQFVKDLASVNVSYTTGYGEIKSSWQRKGNIVSWNFTVPNNSSAVVSLPDRAPSVFTAGQYSLVIDESKIASR